MLTLLLTIVVAGVLLWFVEKYVPMDAAIKTFLRVVVVVALVLYVLNASGLLDLVSAPSPRLR